MRKKQGLSFARIFSKTQDPYSEVKWTKRTIELKGESTTVFKQDGVEVPEGWSDRAAFIAASKYFRGHIGQPGRENSIKQLCDRVVDTISEFGLKAGYYDKTQKRIFNAELKKLLVEQRLAFNSPVFFNVGTVENPQGAACFVLDVEDNLDSISKLQTAETKLFSMGSGAGSNLSKLRSAGEPLSRGGWASGPLSFLRGYDGWAGIIRSGGVLRRASKMVRLDDWHPDVFDGLESGTDFISFKTAEEKKARALFEAGYSSQISYQTVAGQNCNLSVGISNDFMKAALEDREWDLRSPLTGKTIKTVKASEMLDSIAANIWECGDPGVQFDDHINDWNTCPKTGRIYSSNPCGEFLPPGEGACNLLSLNLMKFFSVPDGLFFKEQFEAAVRIAIIAQDIIVDMCSYPLPSIEIAAKKFRPLGLGYANLGGLIMALGMTYNSDTARLLASSVTALMTGVAYCTSAEIAALKGPFPEYEMNKKAMLSILRKHKSRLESLAVPDTDQYSADVFEAAIETWTVLMAEAQTASFRNSQVTLLAPTGTIGLMMDCDTTGVEPAVMLVVNKSLVGGGALKLVNTAIRPGLEALGYPLTDQDKLFAYVMEHGTMEGSILKDKDLPIFDTAYPVKEGGRYISPSGHLAMLAAVQPFVSGGISKTVGQPETVTKADIRNTIINAWKMGVKSLTIYRENSKIMAPLSKEKRADKHTHIRERLPITRSAEIHKFSIAGTEGYLICGFFDDGRLGEIFVTMAKEGSTMRGLMDCFATSISIGLQSTVPLSVYIDKFRNVKFEPNGRTQNRNGLNTIPICSSIIDYIFRYLSRFDPEAEIEKEIATDEEVKRAPTGQIKVHDNGIGKPTHNTCPSCGSIMIRTGPNCEACPNQCPGAGSGTCGA